MMVQVKKLPVQVIIIHPEDKMNVCAKFHGNLSNSCRNISLKTTNVNLMVVLAEVTGSKKHYDPSSEVDVELFQSINENFDLLVMVEEKSQEITKLITTHPLST